MREARYARYETDEQHDDRTSLTDRTCPECDGRLKAGRHETICSDCGLVVDSEHIDHGPEWRSFDEDERRRTGAPVTEARHDRGLRTEMGRHEDANGNTIDEDKRGRLARLRKQHRRSKLETKRDRNQMEGIYEVRRLTSALGMEDSIRNQACRLFKTAQNDDLLRGRSIEAMAAASVYAACRCNDLPRTLGEVVPVARVARSRVENAYGVLNRELALPAVPPTPESYLPQFVSQLDMPTEVRRQAQEFCERAEAADLANGRNPAGVAAACVYLAAERKSGIMVTQAAVCDLADISPPTLRARVEELRELI